jgi:S1-C subfamily serine protease
MCRFSGNRSNYMNVLSCVLLVSLTYVRAVHGQNCSDIVNHSRLSVVHIQAQKTSKKTGAGRVYGGTGFLVSASGVVMTNKHVVAPGPDDESEVKISGAIGSQRGQHSAMRWLANSEITDIAILQFEDTSRAWKPVVIGNPWQIDIGHLLCSMSFPLDIEFATARGVITGKGAPEGWWYSDMPSNPGDSGAPVFDASDGTVVGLKVGDRDDAKGLSYVIPINLADSLLSAYAGIEVPGQHVQGAKDPRLDRITVSSDAGKYQLTDFLKFLSGRELKVSMDSSAASDLDRQNITVRTDGFQDVPLRWVLEEVLLRALPGGTDQWAYDVVGRTVIVKRRAR